MQILSHNNMAHMADMLHTPKILFETYTYIVGFTLV